MKLGRHLCAALALCLVVLCVLPAHGQYQRQCQSLPLDSAILTGQLPCGLTYYIYRCLRPAYKANFYLMCNTGSTVEADHQRGMAHFIEHLAFDGTKHFPGNSLVESLEASGLSFGYDINAFTSHDATVYKITNVDTRMGEGLIDTCLLALKT